MSSQGENISKSLELVAELHGDPTERIYGALFGARPELEELFILDVDSGVRGSMVQYLFDCIDDYVGDQNFVANFMISTRSQHDGYGVPDDLFDEFFVVVRDTFKSILGARWTDDMNAAWDAMLDDFAKMA